jgi:hypothetical protein
MSTTDKIQATINAGAEKAVHDAAARFAKVQYRAMERALREARSGRATESEIGQLRERLEALRAKMPSEEPLRTDQNAADEVVVSFSSPFAADWIPANLSYMDELSTNLPEYEGAAGTIDTVIVHPGNATFVLNAGTGDPDVELWWSGVWGCSCVFPEAPFAGKVYFRFTSWMGSQLIDGSGEVAEWEGVVAPYGTADALTEEMAYLGIATPLLNHRLSPVDGHQYEFARGNDRPVVGGFDLRPGGRPAVYVAVGFAAGLRHSSVQMAVATRTRMTTPQGTPETAYQLGRLEYRYEPDWWIEATSRKIDLQAQLAR